MKMPKITKMLKRFKDTCEFHEWKTSEKDDWIETKEGYHNFLLAKNIHPSSFKSITASGKCVIRQGLSYRVVEVSHTAWLLSEAPSATLVKTISESPDFSRRIAIYNLGPVLEGKNVGFKLNSTDSPVFREFEKFLKEELKVKLRPISNLEIDAEDCAVAKVA